MPKCISCKKNRSAGAIRENGICGYCISQLQKENSAEWVPTSVRKAEIRRREHLSQRFGLTLDDYDRMVQEQDGRCAICRTVPTGLRRALHVDHDHDTGAVRSLLCSECNTGIGKLRDDPALLEAAAAYLREHGKVVTRNEQVS